MTEAFNTKWMTDFKDKYSQFQDLERNISTFALQVGVRKKQLNNMYLRIKSGDFAPEVVENVERIWVELQELRKQETTYWDWFFDGKWIDKEVKSIKTAEREAREEQEEALRVKAEEELILAEIEAEEDKGSEKDRKVKARMAKARAGKKKKKDVMPDNLEVSTARGGGKLL